MPAPSSYKSPPATASLSQTPCDFASVAQLFAEQAKFISEQLHEVFADQPFEDRWQAEIGQGIVRGIDNGQALEKASINFSDIAGDHLPTSGSERDTSVQNQPFKACGISLIIHPKNPHIPTTHLNARLIVVSAEGKEPVWWFGGGFDLTPYVPYREDCLVWHRYAQDLCQDYGDEVYPQFKRQCDEYFFLPHRQETRGIGGLFFDGLQHWGWSNCLEFASRLVPTWWEAWLHIARKRRDETYDERLRNFQLHRRGRYVEFNLLYDRGTLFGLQSQGRTEAILVSLPPLCRWTYQSENKPDAFSTEATHLAPYLKPQDWLNES